MKIRNPTKEEKENWKINGEKHLFYLKVIKRIWEEGIITSGQKRKLQGQIFKKWDKTHEELNPFLWEKLK